MAKGINKVILIGNIGKDLEMRQMPSGTPVVNASLATQESWKDKNTGEAQERTEWHNLVLYSRAAEIAHEYLKKGSKIYVEGSIRTSKWQDKTSGQDRYKTEIIVNNFQMLDAKKSEYESQRAQTQKPESNFQQAPLEDDIPF